ncbi:hypothetical protein [Streptomyces sp. NPDC001537]
MDAEPPWTTPHYKGLRGGDPVIVTGFHASRTHVLTPGRKEANCVLAVGRAPVEHGFAHLKHWRILTNSGQIPPVRRASCAPCSF